MANDNETKKVIPLSHKKACPLLERLVRREQSGDQSDPPFDIDALKLHIENCSQCRVTIEVMNALEKSDVSDIFNL